MHRHWLVTVQEVPEPGPAGGGRPDRLPARLTWPVLTTKLCWTETGAKLWAGRWATTFGTTTTVSRLP